MKKSTKSKLEEYLDSKGIKHLFFAEQLGISTKTLYSIMKGNDTKLSIALKIEEITKGAVKAKDLYKLKKPDER